MYSLLLLTYLTCTLCLLLGERGVSATVGLKTCTELTEVGSDGKCSKETCMFGKKECKVRNVDFVFKRKATQDFLVVE